MSEKTTVQPTKVVTGLVRFSYLQVFEPKEVGEGSEKKYSVSLIIPKKDRVTLEKIRAAIAAAKELGKASKFGGKVPANLKDPLRDGDDERPDDEAYAGAYFINATSKTKPGLVDSNLDDILSSDELYSGCYGRASINFYAFNTNGNKGIAAGLNHLQKVKDGDPMGSRGRAADDFEPIKGDADDFLD